MEKDRKVVRNMVSIREEEPSTLNDKKLQREERLAACVRKIALQEEALEGYLHRSQLEVESIIREL